MKTQLKETKPGTHHVIAHTNVDHLKLSLSLSGREVQVLRLTADGLTAKEIADQLGITDHTVKMHRKNMIAKNGMKNSHELVKYGVVYGIIG